MSLLDVNNLTVKFDTPEGIACPVDNISFTIEENQVVCIVGESGCGKSITARSLLRIVPTPPGRIARGEIKFSSQHGPVDIAQLDSNGETMRSIRGNEIAMIFQEPMTSLNPAYTIGNQISESIILHQKASRREAWKKSIEMLELVGIPSPAQRVHEYPHQFSGGMRQRVMIAIALSCRPALLIADEPTTALDVTVQAQVLDLLSKLRQENRMSVLFITHDLGVVAQIADVILVMYLGKIVEKGTSEDIFFKARHPYTRGLLDAIPSLSATQRKRLVPIEGSVPSSIDLPPGCGFASRCHLATSRCFEETPEMTSVSFTHEASCWNMPARESGDSVRPERNADS